MSQTISPRSNPNSIGGGNFMRFFLLDAGQVAPRIGGHLRYRYANKMKSTSFWDNRRRLIDVCVTINIYYVVWYIYILYCVKMKVMRQPSPTRKELHFRVGISKHSSFRTFLQPSKVVRIVFGKCSQLLPIAFRGFKNRDQRVQFEVDYRFNIFMNWTTLLLQCTTTLIRLDRYVDVIVQSTLKEYLLRDTSCTSNVQSWNSFFFANVRNTTAVN